MNWLIQARTCLDILDIHFDFFIGFKRSVQFFQFLEVLSLVVLFKNLNKF